MFIFSNYIFNVVIYNMAPVVNSHVYVSIIYVYKVNNLLKWFYTSAIEIINNLCVNSFGKPLEYS